MAQLLFLIFFPKKTHTLILPRVTSEVEAVANSWPISYIYEGEVEEVLTHRIYLVEDDYLTNRTTNLQMKTLQKIQQKDGDI